MTIITTEIQKWKRNKIVWCILALTLLLGAFAIERLAAFQGAVPLWIVLATFTHWPFKELCPACFCRLCWECLQRHCFSMNTKMTR